MMSLKNTSASTRFLLQRVLGVGVGDSALDASGAPLQHDFFTPNDEDREETTNAVGGILSNVFLFFLIFGLSATVQVRDLKKQMSNTFALGCGVGMQFLIMPILGFLSVLAFRETEGLEEAMGITLLVVTASPGGSFSNWWCSLFNAELALSVAMTTVSSILSIAMLPANLFLYTYLAYGDVSSEDSEHESVIESLDFATLFITLGVVLAAIVSGLMAGYRWDNAQFHIMANRFASLSGLLLILFSLFLSSGGGGSDSNFWNQHGYFYLAVSFPCLVGILLANIISRSMNLSPPETVAIAIECCYQNTGIATSVAISMFDDVDERAQAVAVPLFYGFVEAVAIAIYCVTAWKMGWTKAPPDEQLCTVISKTYEVSDMEDEDDPQQQQNGLQEHQDVPEGPAASGDKDNLASRRPEESPHAHHAAGGGGGFFAFLRNLFGGAGQDRPTPQSQHVEDEEVAATKKDVNTKDCKPAASTPATDAETDDDDTPRNRFVSADMTVDTSLYSGGSASPGATPRSPDSPGGNHSPLHYTGPVGEGSARRRLPPATLLQAGDGVGSARRLLPTTMMEVADETTTQTTTISSLLDPPPGTDNTEVVLSRQDQEKSDGGGNVDSSELFFF